MNFQMFKLNLEKAEEKAEEPEIKIANIRWIIKKAKEFQKNIYFCFIDCAKPFDSVYHNQLGSVTWAHPTLCDAMDCSTPGFPQEAGKVIWYFDLFKNFPVCCDPQSQRVWRSQ